MLLPSAPNGSNVESIAAAYGVGQPRSAWMIDRTVTSVAPIACAPSAQTIVPTARPLRY